MGWWMGVFIDLFVYSMRIALRFTSSPVLCDKRTSYVPVFKLAVAPMLFLLSQ